MATTLVFINDAGSITVKDDDVSVRRLSQPIHVKTVVLGNAGTSPDSGEIEIHVKRATPSSTGSLLGTGPAQVHMIEGTGVKHPKAAVWVRIPPDPKANYSFTCGGNAAEWATELQG